MTSRDDKLTLYEKIQQEALQRKILDEKMASLLPRRWKRIGHILIIDLKDSLVPQRHEIGKLYLRYVPHVRTVLWRNAPTRRMIRKPQYEIIAGERDTTTIFQENGVRYILDVAKITFSAGNHHERKRLIELVEQSGEDERILDMFACVGNLSMPIAVHVQDASVVGVEINPLAYMYLRKTIALNKVKERYRPILGDNRKITFQNQFDRVLMGYFGISDLQLRCAVESLRIERGGWLHLHELQPVNRHAELPNRLQSILESWNYEKESSGLLQISEVRTKRVKWIAPKLQHLVSDVQILSNSR